MTLSLYDLLKRVPSRRCDNMNAPEEREDNTEPPRNNQGDVPPADESSSEGEPDDTLTPAPVILGQRKTARRRFTDERKAIHLLINSEGAFSVLEVRMQTIARLHQDCVNLQNRYIAKTVAPDDQDSLDAQREWLDQLGRELKETYELATGYRDALQSANREHESHDDQQLEQTRQRMQNLQSPSHLNNSRSANNDVMQSTMIQTQEGSDAAAVEAEILKRRLRLDKDLEQSRIAEERRRDQLTQEARNDEAEMRNRLAAATSAPASGSKRRHDDMNSYNMSRPLTNQSVMGINPIGQPPGVDSWIFETFQPITMDATTAAAMLLLAGAAKSNIQPFGGDHKQWPMFIQNFKATIHDVLPNDAQRVFHLQNSLSPELQREFSRVLTPLTYQRALQDIWKTYGRPQMVVQQYISELRRLPLLRNNDSKALNDFQRQVHGTVGALEAFGYRHELHSSVALAELVGKLPESMALRWGKQVHKMTKTNAFYSPSLQDFDNWLEDEVMGARYVSLPSSSSHRPDSGKTSYYPKSNARQSASISTIGVNTETHRNEEPPVDTCTICNQRPSHSPILCSKFMGMLPQDRLQTLREQKSCFRCLGRKHMQEDCKKVHLFCSAAGCSGTHHSLLHDAFSKLRSNKSSRS